MDNFVDDINEDLQLEEQKKYFSFFLNSFRSFPYFT